MKRLRPWLTALLGLLLLLQGFAVAASSRGISDASNSTAATTAMALPCPMHQSAAPSDELPSCCDDSCPNLLSCALGHLSVTPLLALALPKAASIHHAAVESPLTTRSSAALLRPPITLHG